MMTAPLLGAIETIDQNGGVVIAVMSPERYDALVHRLERGHVWTQAMARIGKEAGPEAREAIHRIARELGIDL